MSRKKRKCLSLSLLLFSILGFLIRSHTVDANNSGQKEIQTDFINRLEQIANVREGAVRRNYTTENRLPITFAVDWEYQFGKSIDTSIVDVEREFYYYLLVDDEGPSEVIAGQRRFIFDESKSVWYYRDDAFFPKQYIAPQLFPTEKKELLSERDFSLFTKGQYGLEFRPKTYSDYQLMEDMILEYYIFSLYPFATRNTPIQDYMEQVVGVAGQPVFYVKNSTFGFVLEDEAGEIVYKREFEVEPVTSYSHSKIPEDALTEVEWYELEDEEE